MQVRAISLGGLGGKKRSAITKVSYRDSIEVRPYQHAHIEAEATVPKGEDPAEVLAALRDFVRAELVKAREAADERTPKFAKKRVEVTQ